MESDLLKIARAVDNDDEFRQRVEIACSLERVEFDRDVLIHVASLCVEKISLSESAAISCSDVPDVDIKEALKSLQTSDAEEVDE